MIQITADSTCDLGEHIQKRGIGIMPLSVILGGKSYLDGVDIVPQDIFDYVEKTGQLPKTAAPGTVDYEEFFGKYVDEGKTVIHFSISSKSSSSNAYAVEAAKTFPDKVFVIDTRALSSGQGLAVMKACDLLEKGKGTDEIIAEVLTALPRINTSFVPDKLEYLYKGGRCSRMAMYGANILRIHPLIEMDNGQLVAQKKYRGNMQKCIAAYIEDLAEKYPNYDATRCFITHSSADKELVQFARERVKETFSFHEILETVAGSVITGHCGRNTLGVLFISC